MTIRLLLAEEHAVLRAGLHLLLETRPDLMVVGEAANGPEAVQLALQLRPDMVIMDIALPELNGIEATRHLRQADPNVHIILLSLHTTAAYVQQALQAGAAGYVLKEMVGTALVEAIYAVAMGQRYLCPKVEAVTLTAASQTDPAPLARLTAREREVLQLVVAGESSYTIAELLSLSPKTVVTYRARILHKLNLPDLPSLIRFASQQGLSPL